MTRSYTSFRSLGLVAALTTALFAATSAQAGQIEVVIDHAKVMRISRPADIVIIGNPAIADATIQDSKTLIITGRSFGTTNLIVLDKDGQPIADEIITVTAPTNQVVTVFRRASRQSYSCTPECAPILIVGDNPEIFETVNAQIQAHGTLSAVAAAK